MYCPALIRPGVRTIALDQSSAVEVTSVSGEWSYAMVRTPGRVNAGQYINPEHPVPAGDSVHVYFNIGSHIWQTVNGVTTNVSKMVVLRKGDPNGLEVTYDIDRWYVLDGVTTNDVAATPVKETDHRYTLTVAKECSNTVVRVNAAARENGDLLSKYGVTADNAYHDAILDWLSGGTDLHGNKWKDDGEDVKLARYEDWSGTFSTNLTLTAMYWLDIPPTEGGWVYRAGIEMGTPCEIVDAANAKTNVRVRTYMMITNTTTDVAYAPYALRGLGVGESSLGLDPAAVGAPAWTSVTFKVTSFMLNGLTDVRDRSQYFPLRCFVFNEDSFYPSGHVDAAGKSDAFSSTIDVRHPYTPASPSYYFYRNWILEHGWVTPSYAWDLDDRINMFTVDALKADSTFKTGDTSKGAD